MGPRRSLDWRGFFVMDGAQRTEFLGKAYEARRAVRPLVVLYGAEEITASGSVAGHGIEELMSGGRRENREASFSVLKTDRAEGLGLGAIVEIGPDLRKYVIRKRWGEDPAAVAWTYWCETWVG